MWEHVGATTRMRVRWVALLTLKEEQRGGNGERKMEPSLGREKKYLQSSLIFYSLSISLTSPKPSLWSFRRKGERKRDQMKLGRILGNKPVSVCWGTLTERWSAPH
ncbi:chromosome organization and biogenesis -related protein [Sesbania bispinosa]|nr:chromosome organization and biogenesis -related protein [Sesbania bispinosa]